nr:MAG TPA: hypothetical protein [Caudoviricetes sp.]
MIGSSYSLTPRTETLARVIPPTFFLVSADFTWCSREPHRIFPVSALITADTN